MKKNKYFMENSKTSQNQKLTQDDIKRPNKQRGHLPVNWGRKSSIVYGDKSVLEDL